MSGVDLLGAARELKNRFGEVLAEAYVPGKTIFRDALCESRALSQDEAEEICDSLEQTKLIRFDSSTIGRMGWRIDPAVFHDE